MRRIGWAGLGLSVAFSCGVAFVAGPGRADEPGADEVHRILVEWQGRMAAVRSLDVQIRMTKHDPRRFVTTSDCRLVLDAPGFALFDEMKRNEAGRLDEAGKPQSDRERVIWTGREIIRFEADGRTATCLHLQEEWDRPPLPLCLPYFYRMTVAEAETLYDWSKLKEEGNRVWLKASRREEKARSGWPRTYFIELDRSTYLPLGIRVRQDLESDRDVSYGVKAIKTELTVGDADWKSPRFDSWKVTEFSEASLRKSGLTKWLFR